MAVAIQFYDLGHLATNPSISDASEWTACNGLNIWFLFILTVLSMVVYILVSGYLVLQTTKQCSRFIMQLLDLALLRAVYINYLCNKTEPCDPQR